MYPLYSEMMSQQQRQEMLQRAEHERLAMAVQKPERADGQFHRLWAFQLGSTMVKWGHKLEQFGTSHRAVCSTAPQNH